MHRSRLHVILLDTPAAVAEQEIDFWTAALGSSPVPEEGTPFTDMGTIGHGVVLAHQRLIDGASRIHLDIETDDTAAEADRLIALGASRVGEHDGCLHLSDPAGIVFCVVPVQSDDFEQHATRWP
jgi:hypothetical protein